MNKYIEDEIAPNRNKLIESDGFQHGHILDAELDLIGFAFLGDNCLTVDTSELSYLKLTEENLETMLKLLNESR